LGGRRAFTVDELDDAFKCRGFDELERRYKDDFLVLFEPPSLDDRIANQYALFSVMTHAVTLPHDWLARQPDDNATIVL
jgi:hypothetical protein